MSSIFEVIIEIIGEVILDYLLLYPGAYIYKIIFARKKPFKNIVEENVFVSRIVSIVFWVFVFICIFYLLS